MILFCLIRRSVPTFPWEIFSIGLPLSAQKKEAFMTKTSFCDRYSIQRFRKPRMPFFFLFLFFTFTGSVQGL